MRRGLPLAALLGWVVTVGAVTARAQSTTEVPGAAAQDTAPERRVRYIASMLRCPVCLNLSVYDSPSELARNMRDLVRERLVSGETEDEVFAYFIQRYGDWVLMKPPARGVSLLVWILPGVLVIGGSALVVLVVKRWIRNAPAPEAAPADEVPEEELRKVREELARERGRID
jgi:cytochrome c-type biogenesis protein CcmH